MSNVLQTMSRDTLGPEIWQFLVWVELAFILELTFVELQSLWTYVVDLDPFGNYTCRTLLILDLYLFSSTHFGATFVELDSFWLHIGSAAWLTIEEGLAMHSQFAAAQMDVQTYFANLPLLLILEWLCKHGVDRSILGAAGRLQCPVPVCIHVGLCTAFIHERSCGGLTGSNLALAFSRVPIESFIQDLLPRLRLLGFQMYSELRITVATLIDNVYSFRETGSGATVMLYLLQQHLADIWQLGVKPDSKEFLLPRGIDQRHMESSDHDDSLGVGRVRQLRNCTSVVPFTTKALA